MNLKIKIQNLTKENVEEIKKAIASLNETQDSEKQLCFDLENTVADIDLAWDVARAIHSSKIDLHTSCRGKLSVGGLILASCGKPDFRTATLGTSFILNEEQADKTGIYRNVNNPNEGVLKFILGKFSGRKKVIYDQIMRRNVISSVDAYTGKLIDSIDDFKNRYKKEKKQKNEDKDKNTNETVTV